MNERTLKQRRVRPVLIHLNPELIEKLDNEAERGGTMSRSALIRRACQELLDRQQKTEGRANV